MSAPGPSIDFPMPQEPLPVPAMDDIISVPLLSPDSQSFVVIKSARDLDRFSDDDDIADISMLQEHKQILQEELAQFEQPSSLPQPSLGVQVPSTTVQVEPDPKITSASPVEANDINNMNRSIFPILPQPQISPQGNIDDHDNRTISIVSFAPSDFGSEEIQAKVTQLIEENLHLKDTILQNNLSMKTQYDRIVAWQKDVERVHEAHKEKFMDAKKCIETLKQELASVKQENENLRCALHLERTELEKSKHLLADTAQNNESQSELNVAKDRVVELERALQDLTLETEKQLASKDSNWKSMEDKLSRYEKELENAYKKIRESRGAAENQENGQIKFAQEKLLLSEMANERANKEIVSLRNQLARNMQAIDDTMKIQRTLDQVLTEKNALAADLECRNANVMDLNLRCSKLEDTLKDANNVVRRYEEDIKRLRDGEEQAKLEAWMTKQKLTEVEQKQCNTQPESNSRELTFIRQQLMNSQKALTDSEHNRAVAEARAETMKNDIVKLRRQLEERQSNDDMFALRAQLDVYKADFEAEQEAKEEVKRDKIKIAEDLQHLTRRNQQLQEEVEILRNRLHEDVSQASSTSNSINEHIYRCPKCNFGFKTLTAAENHVVRCIELDDALP